MRNNDYLWDRSGEPDAEVERLESLLGRLRSDRPAPELPEQDLVRRRTHLPFLLPAVAAAALVAVMAGAAWLVTRRATTAAAVPAVWEVTELSGSPVVGDAQAAQGLRLAVGQWIETDGTSSARLRQPGLGQVDLEPNTRLRLVEARATEHRMALQRGTIHALITAPPRLFYVDTPSAVAVDLGCAYTLEVDAAGAGELSVTYGWVAFVSNGRESFIPAGARCLTRPDSGPGTPFYEDATQGLKSGLVTLDATDSGPNSPSRRAALETVLGEARPRDALTLWHLLGRVSDEERAPVYDRMAAMVPPPDGVTRDGILHKDKKMLDLWWKEPGLGSTSWWRIWKDGSPKPF